MPRMRFFGSTSRLRAAVFTMGLILATPAAAQKAKGKQPAAPEPQPPAVPYVEVEEQKTAYLLSGIAKRQQGRFRDAIDDLTVFVLGNDRDPDGHWELALAYALYNDARPTTQYRQKALEHFKKCYELSPTYQRTLPPSARPGVVALVKEGRKAAGVAVEGPPPRSVDAEGLLRLAEAQVDGGDLTEAKKNYDIVRDMPPPPPDAERERVRGKIDKLFREKLLKIQSLETSNLSQAQAEASNLIRLFPDEPVALETYVKLQMKYSRSAMESIAGQKIYQSYRNNIEGFMLKGQFRDALSEVNRMLFNFPRAEFGERKYSEILEKNETALKAAEEAFKSGRLEEARRKFEEIRRDYPDPGAAQDAISEIDEVRRTLEANLDRDLEKGNWPAVYATAKELSGKFPGSQKAKDAVQSAIAETAAKTAAGKTALGNGRYYDAIAAFTRALSIVPGQTAAQEALEQARSGLREARNRLFAGMEAIPAGRFELGGGPTPESKPKNKAATTQAYFMDRHKVSNAKYQVFVSGTGAKPPETWKNGEPDPARSDFPVTGVSFSEAESFCRWTGKRLPDEFEWEKAARGPEGLDFPYDDAPGRERKAFNPMADYPVNRWPALASPYKIEGMHGAVWEWTSSWFAPYPGNDESSVRNVPLETFRVVRGGARSPNFPGFEKPLPVTARDRRQPEKRDADVGFRCASSTVEMPAWMDKDPEPEKVRQPGDPLPAQPSPVQPAPPANPPSP